MQETKTQILIEKSLHGELEPADLAALQKTLEEDPDARLYLERARQSLDLLLGIEEKSQETVDWKRCLRTSFWPRIHRYSAVGANLLLAGLSFQSLFSLSFSFRMVMIGFVGLMFLMRAANAWLEQREFTERIDGTLEDGQEFMARYKTLVKDELKHWKSERFGHLGAIVFIALLGIFGKYPEICFPMTAGFILLAWYEKRILIAPLKAELAELDQ